jgi:hypothetical protein
MIISETSHHRNYRPQRSRQRFNRDWRCGSLGRGSVQPCCHVHPIESYVAPEPQAWNRIPAAPAGLFVDPGVGHLKPGGKFLGRDDVFGVHQTRGCFGPRGCGVRPRAFRMFEIPRHVNPFPAGGRHNGASTRATKRRRDAGSIGIRGDPERNKICRRQFCLPLWAEDRLTQDKRRRAVQFAKIEALGGNRTGRDVVSSGFRADTV